MAHPKEEHENVEHSIISCFFTKRSYNGDVKVSHSSYGGKVNSQWRSLQVYFADVAFDPVMKQRAQILCDFVEAAIGHAPSFGLDAKGNLFLDAVFYDTHQLLVSIKKRIGMEHASNEECLAKLEKGL